MKQFLFFIFSLPTLLLAQFGYIAYSTTNIGDDIQAIAAKRFLPKDAIPIDREFVSSFKSNAPVDTLMNGFYMHTKKLWWCRTDVAAPEVSWPPSPSIRPLVISFHLARQFMPLAFSEEGIKFFKKYEPIGCRDYDTVVELRDRGVKAYFSGCITLTLENPHKVREDVVYIVDLPQIYVDYIKSKVRGRVEVLSHAVPPQIQLNNEARLKHAESLLEKYRKAKCVVTSKLHVSMPCLAFETPVLLVGKLNERFYGLKELVRNCTEPELLEGNYDFDFNNPTPNTKAYLPLRQNILRKVTSWVELQKNL